jgi:hypothetical protein
MPKPARRKADQTLPMAPVPMRHRPATTARHRAKQTPDTDPAFNASGMDSTLVRGQRSFVVIASWLQRQTSRADAETGTEPERWAPISGEVPCLKRRQLPRPNSTTPSSHPKTVSSASNSAARRSSRPPGPPTPPAHTPFEQTEPPNRPPTPAQRTQEATHSRNGRTAKHRNAANLGIEPKPQQPTCPPRRSTTRHTSRPPPMPTSDYASELPLWQPAPRANVVKPRNSRLQRPAKLVLLPRLKQNLNTKRKPARGPDLHRLQAGCHPNEAIATAADRTIRDQNRRADWRARQTERRAP